MRQAGVPQRPIIVTVTLVGLWLLTQDAMGELYQCRTEAGMVYTDTPAQFTHCTPLSQGGGTTQLGLVGGQPAGSTSPPPSTFVPTQPGIPSTPDPSSAPLPMASTPSGDAAMSMSCSPGLNPLNPFTIPCTADAPSSPPIPLPPATTVPP